MLIDPKFLPETVLKENANDNINLKITIFRIENTAVLMNVIKLDMITTVSYRIFKLISIFFAADRTYFGNNLFWDKELKMYSMFLIDRSYLII